MEQSRPVFEVMSWPDSELEYWAAFFSIDDNGPDPVENTAADNIKYLKEALG